MIIRIGWTQAPALTLHGGQSLMVAGFSFIFLSYLKYIKTSAGVALYDIFEAITNIYC